MQKNQGEHSHLRLLALINYQDYEWWLAASASLVCVGGACRRLRSDDWQAGSNRSSDQLPKILARPHYGSRSFSSHLNTWLPIRLLPLRNWFWQLPHKLVALASAARFR